MKKVLFAGLVVLNASAAENFERFDSGAYGWGPAPVANWTTVETVPGTFVYRGDFRGDALSSKTNLLLSSSWKLEVDLIMRRYYAGDRGLAALCLFPVDRGVQVLANANQRTNGDIQIDVLWFDHTN